MQRITQNRLLQKYITNPSKWACIYRHPTMDPNEFNYYYLNPLLEKLAKEKKNIIRQPMNSLILCHLIWSYLTLSSQLELPPIESLLLIIYFPIIYLSGNSLRQPNINHIKSLTTISYSTPHIFKCSQHKIQHL